MHRLFLAAAALLTLFAGLSFDIRFGDLRYSVNGKTFRHWSLVDSLVPFKSACAAGFIRSGGYPCTTAATSYTLTGPTSGNINVATSNYTVAPNGMSSVTVTPADASHSGVFTPTTVTFSGAAPKTFTYTALQTGTYNISTTNSGSLSNPSAISFTSANQATGYPGLTTGWSCNNCTETTGGASDPFGGSNTATITEDNTTNFHYIHQSLTLTANQSYEISVYSKAGAGTRNVAVQLIETTGFSKQFGIIVDPSTCTVQSTFALNGATTSASSTRTVGSWCLATITGVVGNFTAVDEFVVLYNGSNNNYAGDGSSSVKVYGAVVQ